MLVERQAEAIRRLEKRQIESTAVSLKAHPEAPPASVMDREALISCLVRWRTEHGVPDPRRYTVFAVTRRGALRDSVLPGTPDRCANWFLCRPSAGTRLHRCRIWHHGPVQTKSNAAITFAMVVEEGGPADPVMAVADGFVGVDGD